MKSFYDGPITYRTNRIALFRAMRPALDQLVALGDRAEYFGLLEAGVPRACLFVLIVRPGEDCGRVEKWYPTFECTIPQNLGNTLESTDFDGHFYNKLTFRGVVGDLSNETDERGRTSPWPWVRQVRITEVLDAVPCEPRTLAEDFSTLKMGILHVEVITLLGQPVRDDLYHVVDQRVADAFRSASGFDVSEGAPYRRLLYIENVYDYTVLVASVDGCWRVVNAYKELNRCGM